MDLENEDSAGRQTLHEAWARFDELDCGAISKQRTFRRIQIVLIVLTFVAAVLGIVDTALTLPTRLADALNIAIIAVPVLVTIVASYNSYFRDGEQWLILRGSGESLKREIFRFRSKTGVYSEEQCRDASRESKLAGKVQDIMISVAQSAANRSCLVCTSKADAQRETFLSPDEYVASRIDDQISYYQARTRALSTRLRAMQVIILLAGGIGTVLTTLHKVWAGLATALVTAITAKLQGDQVEKSLIAYNQTLASLQNIKMWWDSLKPADRALAANYEVLVERTETLFEAETSGSLQNMQSSLNRVTERASPQLQQEPSPTRS